MEGARLAIERKFHITPLAAVTAATVACRGSGDWLSQFIAECCDVDSNLFESSGALYNAYRAYCQQNGEFVRRASDFKTAVKQAGFEYKRSTMGVYVKGLSVKRTATYEASSST